MCYTNVCLLQRKNLLRLSIDTLRSFPNCWHSCHLISPLDKEQVWSENEANVHAQDLIHATRILHHNINSIKCIQLQESKPFYLKHPCYCLLPSSIPLESNPQKDSFTSQAEFGCFLPQHILGKRTSKDHLV